MNNRVKQEQAAVGRLCLALGEDDGIDPRYSQRAAADKPACYKELQLCKQAGRVISLVLNEQVNRPLLSAIEVVSVRPEQNGQALRVTVAHPTDLGFAEAEVLAELKPLQGLLRCALAQTVNRKRTPRLLFRYVGASGAEVRHAD